MNITTDYINGLKEMNEQREDILIQFESRLLDSYKNLLAQYSREYCHLVTLDDLVNAAGQLHNKLVENDWRKTHE